MERDLIDRKAPPRGVITFEEFLEWADEDTHAEWEDGKVVMVSPASRRHQELVVWLTTLLQLYVSHRGLGWISSAPFLMRLNTVRQGREPDILFIKTEHMERLRDNYLDGPADLVIEIVSQDSVSRDRGSKYVEYESEGIPEYWLFDPLRRQSEFYRLGPDNRYHLFLPDAEGVYRSLSVDGFWLKVDWLWQEPLPNGLEVLRLLGILS